MKRHLLTTKPKTSRCTSPKLSSHLGLVTLLMVSDAANHE